MDHYVEIRLLRDPEIPATQLLNILFGKLHLALVEGKHDDIGVSFPDLAEEPPSLGTRLRLHGSVTGLGRLLEGSWLRGMRDYIELHSPQPVPQGTQHRCVSRVQSKSSVDRLRRRHMRRHGVSEQEAIARIPDQARRLLDLPYIVLDSHSTDQRFRLFIEHRPLQATPCAGKFNSYGLSGEATVPWF
ncbi:type I-F CRISPR-associated endoribonuclease Cas6/Csy4 [Chitinimonas lacunae]|uniref:Type I-F CRISPR-associated endoribonuclease Cas6/Csy4 n=1 Tax=Chitinimonas lacunae TaxID=1963018 RepID=A0ABV8MQN8_9NEIS